MINYLKGNVLEIRENFIILDVNNVGYQIFTNISDNKIIINKKIAFYTTQIIRQDTLDLYGFIKKEENELFKKLLKVNGVGPKSALSIVCSASVDEINLAIENNDVNFIKQFPGIGLKSAKQIILDLQGKLTSENQLNENLNDAIEALSILGYKKNLILKNSKNIDKNLNTQEIMKEITKRLIK